MGASSLEVEQCEAIAGVVIVRPVSHGDQRGRFTETYRRSWFPEGAEMVQGNRSDKQAGSLVGLHYHLHQADYWYVTRGVARVVLHDLRRGSPTEGSTFSFDMGDGHDCGVYIPPGVGHGFAALTDLTVTYLVDHYYDPDDELGVAWDDPEVGADWGVADPVLSARDRTNPRRVDLPADRRPAYPAEATT
ncbi:MAG: dTDP-4-dehydrorhamnose 3,5-epimerase family protein [Acidimicrobiia bacterium]